MPSVLCFYLVNTCLMFSILYMLCKSLMAGWGPSSEWGSNRSRKHGLPFRTHAPSTTSTMPVSTTPSTTTTFTPLGHPPYTQEFVMIPNPGYVESGPQPSFPPQPSPPLPSPHLYLVPHFLYPPASLVRRVPKSPCPSPHKAPQTSAWSLNMMVNPSK